MSKQRQRKSVRLRDYDYRDDGAYFVTICTYRREELFGHILEEAMRLTALGEIAQICWNDLSSHFPFVNLDVFVVMPNHLHGIIIINRDVVGARHASPLQASLSGAPAQSLGVIVGSYKSAAAKQINQRRTTTGSPVWQRGYHDRIVRGERELTAIREYILYNPMRWGSDENNPLRSQP